MPSDQARNPVTDAGYEFALCLTHDVDRPFKTAVHALYYALTERRAAHLRDLLPDANPYWMFDEIMTLEADLDVRSAFYFLSARRLGELPRDTLTDPTTLIQQVGRYDVRWPEIAAVIQRLDAGGWEVGLHGSYHSATDRERLAVETQRIEAAVGHPILGGRQHYLRADVPATWRHYADLGLRYDASLGSTSRVGFHDGYRVLRPFGDEFAVFPLTVMEQALPDPGEDPDAAWEACESLLAEAAANDAVMTALWHPRYFNEAEFPGHRRLYRRLVERAIERGAWVGSPGEFYALHLEPGTELPLSTQSGVEGVQ